MLQLFSYALLTASAGALVVIGLVLTKGEICPGQRGRLHQNLIWPILAIFLASLMLPSISQSATLISLILLGIFFFKAKKGKSASSQNIFLFYGASFFSILGLFALLFSMHWQMILLILSHFFLLGACFSHCLLVSARSRLAQLKRSPKTISV